MGKSVGTGRFSSRLNIIIVGFLLLSAAPIIANALLKEPTGFRAMKWGADSGELPKAKLLAEEGDLRFYLAEDEKLRVGDAHLDKIVYGFYKGKFFNVMLYFTSLPNFMKLKETCIQEFGEPHQPNQYIDNYFWEGLDITISLTYDDVSKQGRIAYFYKPIQNALEGEEKQEAKRAGKDLE